MGFKRIHVASDFGPSSRRAVDLAADLAKQYRAELVVVHVIEPFAPPYPIDPMTIADARAHTTIEAAAQLALDEELTRLKEAVPSATGVLRRGKAAQELAHFAEEDHAELLVIGTHGRTGPSRWIMGSVAEKAVRFAHLPVLSVRA